jgi:hypothetical protein
VPSSFVGVELYDFLDSLMQVHDARRGVDRLCIERTRYEISVVQGNSESLFESRKVGQMESVLLFSFSRRGNKDAFLQSPDPSTEIINTRRGTDDAETDVLRFLCLFMRAIEKETILRMRCRLLEIELKQRLIEM